MNSSIRIIPRLDIKGPNLIKGIQFDGYRVLGTPEYFARHYAESGADELIFQDVVASLYQRNSLLDVIKKVSEKVFIPMTVAGGIRTIDDIRQILRAGADKVAINTAAVGRSEFLTEAAEKFGSQCVVASLEVYRHADGRCEIWTDYGRQPTGIDAFAWAEQVVKCGAGEILLTSINRDGTGRGYDIELIERISKSVPVPVIAGGGAGKKEDFEKVIQQGCADAVSAASVFHYAVAKPVDGYSMTFNEKRLRLGESVDSGNIDFLNFGYGGYTAIPVSPVSLASVKSFLSQKEIPVRQLKEVPHA